MKKLLLIPFLALSVFAADAKKDPVKPPSDYITFVDKINDDFKEYKDLKYKKYKLYGLAAKCIEKETSKAGIRRCESILKNKLNVLKKDEIAFKNLNHKLYQENRLKAKQEALKKAKFLQSKEDAKRKAFKDKVEKDFKSKKKEEKKN